MNLSVKAMGFATGLLWGGCLLLTGLVNIAYPAFGAALLRWASSIYPGFHNSRTLVDVLVGTCYGLVDGGIGGAIFAWLYNVFAKAAPAPKAT